MDSLAAMTLPGLVVLFLVIGSFDIAASRRRLG